MNNLRSYITLYDQNILIDKTKEIRTFLCLVHNRITEELKNLEIILDKIEKLEIRDCNENTCNC